MESKAPYNQSQVVYIKVKGKSYSDQDFRSYKIKLEGFVGGMTDSATISYLGFNHDELPIINTSIGPLILRENYFDLCRECIKFISKNNGQVLKTFNLPNREVREFHFRFSRDGLLLIKNGSKCIASDNKSLFKIVKDSICTKSIDGTKLLDAEKYPFTINTKVIKTHKILPKMKREFYYQLYKSKNLDYYIYARTNTIADT